MSKKILAVLSLASIIVCTLAPKSALADVETSQATEKEQSYRMNRRIGLSMAFAEPAPGILGVNANYNVTDYLRVTAGFASIETTGMAFTANGFELTKAKATTIGAGAKAMVPGWNLTPTLGLHYGHISYSGAGGITVGGFSKSGGHVYSSLGAVYQGKRGYDVGLGYNYSFKKGIKASAYVSVGWYFDWLGT